MDQPHLRRVVRSGLAASRNVAEAILTHRLPGFVGVYDLHEYEDEKREALEKWTQRLASIFKSDSAAPAKVVKLRGGGGDGPADRGAWPPVRWRGVAAVLGSPALVD